MMRRRILPAAQGRLRQSAGLSFSVVIVVIAESF